MNLIYTVPYDLPGRRGSRTMAKLLCSSLLRGFWGGQDRGVTCTCSGEALIILEPPCPRSCRLPRAA
jgi:hypothetical protein